MTSVAILDTIKNRKLHWVRTHNISVASLDPIPLHYITGDYKSVIPKGLSYLKKYKGNNCIDFPQTNPT